MKKQMKRTVYEAPVTERFQVELEGTFCASANLQGSNGNATINEQEVNEDFTLDFSKDTWDKNSTL